MTIPSQPFFAAFSDHVAQQRATQRASAVNHQHLARAVLLSLLTDQRIVLKAFERHDLAAKRITATEVAEHWLDHLNLFRVSVAQVRGDVVHGVTPVRKGSTGRIQRLEHSWRV
jgi:hypothetical protein